MPSARQADLPSKPYYRIGEVAELVGVEPHVLRYWEREFRSIRPTKSTKGQRVYSRRDLQTLVSIRELLYKQEFTIAGARRKLRAQGDEPPGDEKDLRAGADNTTREQLVTLRREIEAFLSDLGPARR